MSQVENLGVSMTLKTRCKSTSYKITSLSYEGNEVIGADLSIDYVRERFYEDEGEEGLGVEVIVTSESLVTTTTALKGLEPVIDYESAVTLALTSRL